jgi:hypothetical protein
MMKRTAALIAAGALAVPTATMALAAPAHADVERHGSIGKGDYDFSVDREGSGFEVSFDIDRVAPGSKWKVVLRHDGQRVLTRTLTADHEGELDVETFRPNTAGKDVFKVRASKVKGKARATATITVS